MNNKLMVIILCDSWMDPIVSTKYSKAKFDLHIDLQVEITSHYYRRYSLEKNQTTTMDKPS